MNLREKIKRFWTLDVHNHEGFTLVELIIVIAILAILSSVAVVGYSSYVTKANKQADLTLAAEIENALILAMYSDALTAGDYVVIYADGSVATYGNDNAADGVGTTIYAAMAAAYGDGWENNLKLKWNGWDTSAAVDNNTMAIVNSSNFTSDNMDALLSQVQVVVGAAGSFLEGKEISKEAADMLNANGIDISAGDKLTADTANAAANGYVYCVAGELAPLNLNTNPDNWGNLEASFLDAWMTNTAPSASDFDLVTGQAVQYASIFALATYIDKNTNDAKDYTKQMEEKGDVTIIADASKILADMKATYPDLCTKYQDDGDFFTDAISFLAYMQGVSASTDSLMQNTNLMNKDYFVDGYVADYVDNYISLSGMLPAEGAAFAFIFNGTEIICMPLDW